FGPNELSGTLTFAAAQGSGAVLEAEPNDSVDTAHDLGQLAAGSTLVVRGHTTTDAGDPFDGFRLQAPGRVRVTATMDFDDSAGNDFDMFVYEPASMQAVEDYYASTAPEVGVFHAKGVFYLVVYAYAGSGDYVLTVTAEAPAAPIAEREPNGTWSSYSGGVVTQAQWLGEAVPGDSLQLAGSASSSTDAREALYLSLPSAARVALSLSVPLGADFDLRAWDGSTDRTAPTLLATFNSTSRPETGTLEVQAGTLLGITVDAFSGSGPWTLTVNVQSPLAMLSKPGGLVARGAAHKSLELARAKAPAHGLAFGRILTRFVPGEVLVGWQDAASGEAAAGAGALAGRAGKLREAAGPSAQHLEVQVPDGLDAEAAARSTLARVDAMAGLPGVRYAEPNRIRQRLAEPSDPLYNLQWHYPLMRLPEAWDITTGSASVVVAVIDTGRKDHPDLAGNQSGGYDFISDVATAADGNGRDSDPTDAGDAEGGYPSSWHGTHVAGTIGARASNGIGGAGVCWNVTIMHLRVLGKGGGTDADIAAAIRYAAGLSNAAGVVPATPARIINMSLGGPGTSQTMQDAVTAARAAGVTVFAAAGNEATSAFSVPAGLTGVIGVSAVDAAGVVTSYSNYGPSVDLACPGGDSGADKNGDGQPDGVLSTLYDQSTPPKPIYEFYDGTSMACPHAAGVAALMLSVNSTLTPAQVETLMTSTAEDRGTPGRDDRYGHGLVNAAAAVRAAQGATGTTPLLSVSPLAISMGSTDTTRDAYVANVGGGALAVGTLAVSTDSGGSWLSASTFGSGNATRNVDGIRITASRTGLADGSYAGRVQVASNGGSATVQVLLQVGSSGGGGGVPDLTVYVLAVDATTGDTVREEVVTTATASTFRLRNLPDGTYLLYAGTDLDNDGFICGTGEWCGAWPVASDPQPITVAGGEVLSGLEVLVAADESVGAAKAGPRSALPGLRRVGCGRR
ncbi:MAG: S8 family serine peptidase, partial [Planctomycetia bacterium]